MIRAYSSSASEALNKTQITPLTKGYNIIIEFPYENLKQINYLLKDYKIYKYFGNKITYSFNIEEEKYINIENQLKKLSNIKTKKPITITS